MTTVKVPAELRDRIKAHAADHDESQSDYIERAVRELEYREWLTRVEAFVPDETYLAEARAWDEADLSDPLP